jgi:hypothetical protein
MERPNDLHRISSYVGRSPTIAIKAADTELDGSYRELRPCNVQALGIILSSRRRKHHQPMRGVGGAWLDQDKSGTYDPKLQAATPPARRIKRARRFNGTACPSRSFRRKGYSLPMSFKFTSNRALSFLRSITPGPYTPHSTSNDDGLSVAFSDSEEETRRRSRRKIKKPSRLAR